MSTKYKTERYPGQIQDLNNRADELESMLAQLMSVRVFSEDALKRFYPVKCAKCGWIGLSSSCGGGCVLGDTGDYDDITCPVCYSKYIDDPDDGDITVQNEDSLIPAQQARIAGLVSILTDLTKVHKRDMSAARARIEELEARVESYRTANTSKAEAALTSCEWTLIDAENPSVYNTGCGSVWEFAEADIKDTSIEFCPFCGKVIEVDKNEI